MCHEVLNLKFHWCWRCIKIL